ncbi:MAG: hypothetical protein ACRC62_27460, partial [Microcoleus sp.]
RLLISVVKISLSCEIGQPPHRNQPGFHPTPICKRYVVGIPAELAKKYKVRSAHPTFTLDLVRSLHANCTQSV